MSEEETVKYTLKKPITDEKGNRITELAFREPELGDLIAAEKLGGGPQTQTIAILAGASGIGLPLFRKIKTSDMNGILEACRDFLDVDISAPDGGTSPS